MKSRRWKRPLLIACCFLALIAGISVIWLFQEDEYLRIDSSEGEYTAIVTYRRYESFRPTLPGQSGDKAGFIRIEGKDGRNYGRISVPMVWMASDLEWTDDGAELKLICEWDFAKREYRFWNEAQTKEIVKHAK